VITPVSAGPEFPDIIEAGYGRIIKFKEPQVLGDILTRITKGIRFFGDSQEKNHVNVAVPQSIPIQDRWKIPISSIGICAGSGGSILNGVDVDMLLTGELSHHEALAAIEQGRVVVTTYHSNSERGYLHSIMQGQLRSAIEDVLRKNPGFAGFNEGGEYFVTISKADRDPFIPVTIEEEL
jgi:putative NIF3 family GTP cyclohydrolase 1 type 2